jgi:hypothetical protein
MDFEIRYGPLRLSLFSLSAAAVRIAFPNSRRQGHEPQLKFTSEELS